MGASQKTIRPISPESPQALHSPGLPEAAGAGSFDENGNVRFGDAADPGPVFHHEPRRDPDEMARERASIPHRCDFCAGIPAELLAELASTLDAARKAGRR
jgi:hypothetical protein